MNIVDVIILFVVGLIFGSIVFFKFFKGKNKSACACCSERKHCMSKRNCKNL